MEERFYWLSFSVFPGIGPIKFQSLIKHFGTAKNAWFATFSDLKNVLGEKLAFDFESFRQKFSIQNYAEKVKSKDVSFLILTDKEYPKLLKEIPNPPFLLYVKSSSDCRLPHIADDARRVHVFNKSNDPSSLNESRLPNSKLNRKNKIQPAFSSSANGQSSITSGFLGALNVSKIIAVVGTRKITQYGEDVTQSLTEELVNAGFTIVSGLAFGVDSVAHKTTVENNGKTIAVLGCGVDCCTPPSNQKLYDDIVKNGCVVSEFPLSQIPTKGSFPSRNRIIAGLSLGVLVTEGAEDSGALITADYALKFNRKVFAVPGPITSSLSKGPHKLLSKGAKLVVKAEDIINELGITGIKSTTSITGRKGETKEEEKILQILENEALHFNQIVQKLKMDSAKVGSILSMMEIKGMVKSLESGYFAVT